MTIILQIIRYLLWALSACGLTALMHILKGELDLNFWGELTWYYLFAAVAVLVVIQMAILDKKQKKPRTKFIFGLILVYFSAMVGYELPQEGLFAISPFQLAIVTSLIGGVLAMFVPELITYQQPKKVVIETPNLTPEERHAQLIDQINTINNIFDKKMDEFTSNIRFLCRGKFESEKYRLIKKGEYIDVWKEVPERIHAKVMIDISRPLSSITYRELEACRIYCLASLDLLNETTKINLGATLAWGDGKATIGYYNYNIYKVQGMGQSRSYPSLADSPMEAMEWFIKNVCRYQNIDAAISKLLSIVNQAETTQPNNPVVQEIKRRLEAGNAWLDSGQFEGTGFINHKPQTSGLFLGNMPNNQPCWFAGEGSVITVAPPGSGKTQTHVIPNLLYWNGPAVILDVKGELWDKTAACRKAWGPVYKFSPLDPDNSHSFNPLTLIRNNPDYIWEDCKYLADLMVVKSETKDPFWENRARDLITAAIAVECLENDPEDRDMANVVGYCYGRDWTKMLAILHDSPVNAMKNASEGWINTTGNSEKTLDGIKQQAQTFMSAWEGSRVERATRKSDWHPLDLRGDKPVTLYISLKAGEIDAYASLLRVFIGTQIRSLIQDLPKDGSPDILFMLDELPRLKYMPPIEEALELGRQYGLKLFMVIQSIGQLKKHYKNADGLMGSCAVQAYMNPASNDGTAEHLTKILGQIESIVDGSRRQLVEISDLTGPEFKDKVLIMSSGAKPIKANKAFAYQDERLANWMDKDPPNLNEPGQPTEEPEPSTKDVY